MKKSCCVSVSCVICKKDSPKYLKKLASDGHDIGLVQCIGCGLVFLSPRFSNDYISELYASNRLDNASYYSQGSEDDAKTFSERLSVVEPFLKRRHSVIDIGASVGTFLSICRLKKFNELYGVELNSESRKRAKMLFDVDLHPHLPDTKADLVNMSDVIEHLSDPLEYLVQLKNNMTGDSVLMITTPDYDKLITRLVNVKPDEHLYYFTKETLRKLLETAGFEVLLLENTTRFRRFRHLAVSTNAKNPVIRMFLSVILAVRADAIAEKLFFNNLNNDLLCISRLKEK